jgi:hypothetical protein
MTTFASTSDMTDGNQEPGTGKMRKSLREKIVRICDKKIAEKGADVGLSFYAFFSNTNDDPEALMEAATWWIKTKKLDHFEKAEKIKKMVQAHQE